MEYKIAKIPHTPDKNPIKQLKNNLINNNDFCNNYKILQVTVLKAGNPTS